MYDFYDFYYFVVNSLIELFATIQLSDFISLRFFYQTAFEDANSSSHALGSRRTNQFAAFSPPSKRVRMISSVLAPTETKLVFLIKFRLFHFIVCVGKVLFYLRSHSHMKLFHRVFKRPLSRVFKQPVYRFVSV